MGFKVNAQLKENKEYVNAVEEFMELYMLKYFSLLRRYNWYYRFTSDYKKEQKTLKILKNMTKVVVANRKKERDANENKTTVNADNEFGIKKRTAFLDLLLDMKDEDALTEQELNDEVNTFLFAVNMFFISCSWGFRRAKLG